MLQRTGRTSAVLGPRRAPERCAAGPGNGLTGLPPAAYLSPEMNPKHALACRDEEQELALKLFVVLTRAHTAVARITEQDIARLGFSPGEFAILEALYHRGPLLLGEVQRKVLVSSGGVTYLVDRLVAQGLVERQECPTDRRARYAALTSSGEELIGRAFPSHAEAVEGATSGLSKEEKRVAIRLLRKLGLAAAE
jgi:MarR family 2-MHQ and catechol resistance regulon transcriptional repressor